jgi:3-oxoisoapionate decarboxylase
VHRRQALKTLAAGATALNAFPGLGAQDKPPRTQLGIVVYCLSHRTQQLREQQPGGDLSDPLSLLEHCHQLGAGGVQMPLGVRDEAYSRTLREKAEQSGMFVEGIVSPPSGPADVERFDAQLATVQRAGADVVRTVIMPGRRYEFFESEAQFREFSERGRRALELAEPVAAKHRVRLAVENHKDQRVPERIELLRRLSSPWIGACVDVGNSFSLLEDPLAVVEAYAPWAISVHLKDQTVQEYEDGFLFGDAALGKGFLDLKRMVQILRQAKPEVRFSLEVITRDPLQVPCLTEKYWATLTDVPGTDLARTLRIVRVHAQAVLLSVSGLALADRAELEEGNIRQSLVYARSELGL